jgi:polysaccharide export outer membrane protein
MAKKYFYQIMLLLGVVMTILTGCNVQKKVIQPFRDEKYESIYREGVKRGEAIIRRFPTTDTLQYYRYRIQSGDELRIRFLNLPPELAQGSFEVKADEKYIVNIDGYLATPLIGRLYVGNKTTEEVQKKITQEYSQYFKNPSIDVSVSNLKIYLYGEGKQGVIILPTERTHLLEALAIAGGVPREAKSNKIKIIRGDPTNPQIIWVNLNQIAVLKDEDLYMRSGDIIYLEPRNLYLFVREFQPYSTLLTVFTVVPTIYLLVRTFTG